METNGLAYLTVGDKTIGFKFGMQAILELDGISDEVDTLQLKMASVTKIAWAGYRNWVFNKEQQPMSFEEFNDFLDEAFLVRPEFFVEIVNTFRNSKIVQALNGGNTEETEVKEGSKKKTPPQKKPQKKS